MRKTTSVSIQNLRWAIALLTILFVSATAQTATVHVTNTNDSGPGSLRDVVASASSGDAIDFNLTGCPCTIPLTTGQIIIDKNLTIAGLGADRLTISGNNVSRIFYLLQGVDVNISGVTLANGNASDSGGAIVNLGTLHLTNAAISDNTAYLQGGGIYNNGFLFVTSSTISGNTAINGGGIYTEYILYVNNSTISSNRANYGYGGAIYLSNRSYYANVYNTTISANLSDIDTGGIYNVSTYGNVDIGNSIIAANNGYPNNPDVWGNFHSFGYNLIGVQNGSTGFTHPNDQKGTSSTPLNPQLGPLQNNGGPTPTQALLPGSPAIDQGYAIDPVQHNAITEDQRGMIRPFDDPATPNAQNGSDIGAFELDTRPHVTNTNDSGPGSLRDSVARAASGDTIDFILSGCPCTIRLTTGQIVMDKSLTITGLGADRLTISGNNVSRIFYLLQGVDVNISALTLANGNASDSGGAIVNLGTLHLTNAAISDNTAYLQGGGLYNNGTLYVTSSTISDNTAINGGGIYTEYILYVNNSTISSNRANYGYGGAIYLSNRSYYANVYNSTVSANISDIDTGGIYNVSTYGNTDIGNTIIAANIGWPNNPDVWGNFYSFGYNLIGVQNGSTGFTHPTDQKGTSSTPLNPQLGPLQNNGGPTPTHALLPGSPAIDQGQAIDPIEHFFITDDQRGMIRPSDDPATPNVQNGSDIGAFELYFVPSDTTPPVITPNVSGTLGNNGWYVSDVQVSWSVVDNESTVSSQSGCDAQTISTDTANSTFTCTATSAGGTNSQSVTIKRDATAPTLAPTVSPNPVPLNGTATATPNASDDLSGIASQSCAAVDTSSVGTHSVACTATDNAGNTTTANASYQVVGNTFNFAGFFQPVDNLPTLNVATAGSAIPVKFSLGGNQGLAIFAAGYPGSSQIQCDLNEAGDQIEETVNAGGSSLSYDSTTNQYTYVWKTVKSWKGTCRMLVVIFTDGSQHLAKFRFK